MATIGEQLKQARTQRNVTLEQAAQRHAGARTLSPCPGGGRPGPPPIGRAGEGLPSPVYADYLGLPVEPLLDQWMGKYQKLSLRLPPQLRKPPSSRRLLQKSFHH